MSTLPGSSDNAGLSLGDDLFRDQSWTYHVDGEFCLSPTDSTSSVHGAPPVATPCSDCKPILSPGGSVGLSNLTNDTHACSFCAFILRKTNTANPSDASIRNTNSLITVHTSGLSEVQPILRLYPGSRRSPDGPAGIPKVSPVQLLRPWLEKCDQSHKCRQHHVKNQPNEYTLPTRLLSVSPSSNPDDLRLDVLENVETDRYIALSHCWGLSDPDKLPPHCTTRDNVKIRQRGFKLSELPKTFKDAIKVTRELGVQYLWIDSLCIIQGQDGNWEQESKRMKKVFQSAYCTIAATSAENSNAGFLGGQVDHESIYVQDPAGQHIYVSTNMADFDNDVNEANLNKRAWVMQERYLSPRTIHFCENQVYGECGKGVYAGGKIFLTSRRQTNNYFKLDPEFPHRLRGPGPITTLEFLQSLLEDYTQRGISIPTDRVVAISGLMDRIKTALPSSIHHGIIDLYLHRTLLWRRSAGQKTTRIGHRAPKVPSWSWMAYDGAIRFVHDKFNDLRLIKDLVFDAQVLTATVWELTDFDVRFAAGSHNMGDQLLDSKGLKKGCISLDEEAELTVLPDVVIVAKRKTAETDNCRYFVLFVRLKESQDVYERIGMGMLQEDCGLRKKGKGLVF